MTPAKRRIGSRELLDALLDPGTFVSWDAPPIAVAQTGAYRSVLAEAATAAGTDESVRTGEGRLRGRRIAVIACEFAFLAGSVGVAAAERIVGAVERATAEGLPLVVSPTSGGTRMQEGTVAFVQMVKIAGAVAAHKSAGHPYVVYLRNPTMGGVFASWGSLGHITFAEPGALIGFLGPRVYEALYGQPFPPGVQTAENLYRSGVIDGVVEVSVFRRIAHRALSVFSGIPDEPKSTAGQRYPGAEPIPAAASPDRSRAAGRPDSVGDTSSAASTAVSPTRGRETQAARETETPEVTSGAVGPEDAGVLGSRTVRPGGGHRSSRAMEPVEAWESVRISRRSDRPGLRELLRRSRERVPLSGTGQGETDRTVVLALARFQGRPCVVFGHDRAHQDPEHTMGPAALRSARRSMQLAAELRLPLVLVIDTIGAALSKEAEERGLAPEIARCIADLVTLDTPTVSVLLGQGTGGGALALLPADRVLAATHGWLAPLPPEGASAIVHRDTGHAAELAAQQRIRSADLLADGIVDRIVPENPDAAAEPDEFARRMVTALGEELAALSAEPVERLREIRHLRYRRLGLADR
ncbi:carboxyl transferase domain-containing protein [Nocardia flavorosea]|uniref:Acetyl-coenzyme A carboxylase carboxyl transferase subunits beta/alpha n=1 Tax=Nocardia flavorosea TaxID=53429 RepID=A0A846YRF0_9NOCA|nr:carboxyl transferase domain-containing protein [Nocardia flavorosea]NKY60140.1 acetyl-CoA carboxyl transferase [Nocardia flavorosea]